MNPPGIFGRTLTISMISGAIAFSPAVLFVVGDEAGNTGSGAYVILFFVTIPLGLAVFIIGNILSIDSHTKSLSESEKKQTEDKLRRWGPRLILLIPIYVFLSLNGVV